MKLQRTSQNDQRTYGELLDDDGTLLCHTLERPWVGNKHGVSCIPAGTYPAFRFSSPHLGYELFQLANVPDRVGIDIHIGNRVRDSEGCILVGKAEGQLDGEDAILQSRAAFHDLMAHLEGVDRFTLEVVDAA